MENLMPSFELTGKKFQDIFKPIVLNVQKYLREGGKSLESLKSEFGINYSFDAANELAILNYDQIDSSNHKAHPIVIECRGLILEVGTWDVVAHGLDRFFNYGEGTATKFPKRILVLEKVDGTMINIWNYKGKWRMSTRGVIDGVNMVGDFGVSFYDLFMKAVKNSKYGIDMFSRMSIYAIYTFELTSPENKVVTPYIDASLCLINVRNTDDGIEWHGARYGDTAEYLGVRAPKVFEAASLDQMRELFKAMRPVDEGFVCINTCHYEETGSYYRFKFKNPSYLAIHHLKDSATASMRGLVLLALKGEESEFLSYFPEYKERMNEIVLAINSLNSVVQETWERVKPLLENSDKKEARKSFAQQVCKYKFSPIMFSFADGKTNGFDEFVKELMKAKGEDLAAEKIWEMVSV